MASLHSNYRPLAAGCTTSVEGGITCSWEHPQLSSSLLSLKSSSSAPTQNSGKVGDFASAHTRIIDINDVAEQAIIPSLVEEYVAGMINSVPGTSAVAVEPSHADSSSSTSSFSSSSSSTSSSSSSSTSQPLSTLAPSLGTPASTSRQIICRGIGTIDARRDQGKKLIFFSVSLQAHKEKNSKETGDKNDDDQEEEEKGEEDDEDAFDDDEDQGSSSSAADSSPKFKVQLEALGVPAFPSKSFAKLVFDVAKPGAVISIVGILTTDNRDGLGLQLLELTVLRLRSDPGCITRLLDGGVKAGFVAPAIAAPMLETTPDFVEKMVELSKAAETIPTIKRVKNFGTRGPWSPEFVNDGSGSGSSSSSSTRYRERKGRNKGKGTDSRNGNSGASATVEVTPVLVVVGAGQAQANIPSTSSTTSTTTMNADSGEKKTQKTQRLETTSTKGDANGENNDTDEDTDNDENNNNTNKKQKVVNANNNLATATSSTITTTATVGEIITPKKDPNDLPPGFIFKRRVARICRILAGLGDFRMGHHLRTIEREQLQILETIEASLQRAQTQCELHPDFEGDETSKEIAKIFGISTATPVIHKASTSSPPIGPTAPAPPQKKATVTKADIVASGEIGGNAATTTTMMTKKGISTTTQSSSSILSNTGATSSSSSTHVPAAAATLLGAAHPRQNIPDAESYPAQYYEIVPVNKMLGETFMKKGPSSSWEGRLSYLEKKKAPQVAWFLELLRTMGDTKTDVIISSSSSSGSTDNSDTDTDRASLPFAFKHIVDVGGGRGDLGVAVALKLQEQWWRKEKKKQKTDQDATSSSSMVTSSPAPATTTTRVTVIDVNEASLESGRERAKSLGLTNIDFVVADIGELAASWARAIKHAHISPSSTTVFSTTTTTTSNGTDNIPLPDLLIGLHACGTLTDRILELASITKSSFAVVPCCFAKNKDLGPTSAPSITYNLYPLQNCQHHHHDHHHYEETRKEEESNTRTTSQPLSDISAAAVPYTMDFDTRGTLLYLAEASEMHLRDICIRAMKCVNTLRLQVTRQLMESSSSSSPTTGAEGDDGSQQPHHHHNHKLHSCYLTNFSRKFSAKNQAVVGIVV